MFSNFRGSIRITSAFALILVSSIVAGAQTKELPVFDDEFSCTTRTTAQKYVSDFAIDTASFGGLELCNSSVDTKKLLNDIGIIEMGEFSGDGNNPLIRSFVPINNYYGWMKSMTRGMDRGNDIPWATAYNRGGYFTMQDGWAKLSTLGRVGTIVHEARHTAGYRHMPCNKGPYANLQMDACDRDFNYGGSHAIEMEYYARVAIYGTNFHPAYKYMARLMAMGRSNFVFNGSPITQREALIAVDAQGRSVLWDGKTLVARDGNVDNRRLKRTSFGASLMDLNRTLAFAIDPYGRSRVQRDVPDDYSYYKLLMDDRGQGKRPLLDAEEIDLGVKRFFVVLNDAGQIGGYVFRQGKFGAMTNAPRGAVQFAQHSPSGAKGLYLRNESGEIFQLNPENLTQATALKDRWPQDAVTFVKDGDNTLVLTTNGEVLNTQTGTAYGPFQNLNVRQIVNVPLYNAFEVSP